MMPKPVAGSPASMKTMMKTAEELMKERMMENLLKDDLAPFIEYLDDDEVTDIAVPDSGELIVTRFGKGREFTGKIIQPYLVERVIKATASIIGKSLESYTGFPLLEGRIPKYNARITGLMPPTCERPELQIRKPPKRIYTLEEYVEHGQMPKDIYEKLCSVIEKRGNIIVSGSTGSGKTTCTNTIIKKMCEFTPDDNFYVVEDTPELQCSARMKTMLCISKEFAQKAVEESLRFSPDRIIFGEVRNGLVMHELLDAWKTGHSGNVTTIHSNDCKAALMRIRSMVGAGDKDMADHLSEVIQLVIHLKKTKDGIRVDDFMPVTEETDRQLASWI